MSDLWLMVALVVALLIGNLWLLKRNSKQQLPRKSTVSRPVQSAQTAAAVQTSPVVAAIPEKNNNETPAAKSASDTPGQSSANSEGAAD
ncbi:MAG: hypothetical protein U5L02_14860 [Rheinheimera sp.]|nr:hypothetical protein [Rheinheimera sp.]